MIANCGTSQFLKINCASGTLVIYIRGLVANHCPIFFPIPKHTNLTTSSVCTKKPSHFIAYLFVFGKFVTFN